MPTDKQIEAALDACPRSWQANPMRREVMKAALEASERAAWEPINTRPTNGDKITVGAWLRDDADGRMWVTASVFPMGEELLWEGGDILNWRATHWLAEPAPPPDSEDGS